MSRILDLPQLLKFVALLSLLLCGSCDWQAARKASVAPVSGTVRLDSKPLENVKVLFVPIDRTDSGGRLPVAFAVTDAKGRYTLAHTGGANGAVVGRNQVFLTTRRVERAEATETESPEVKETSEELIPPKYNRSTGLVFDVPTEGTENADFDLQSK